jgi:uncharacterized protein
MSKSVRAIDAVVNIWTPEALSHRPGWGPGFFVGKMKVDEALMRGLSLEELIDRMDAAGIDHGFLVAHKSGRPGLPGCYHLPYALVARAVAQHPDRFHGLAGVDPFEGMKGVRALASAVRDDGFIGAHCYPHWFDLPPDDAKYYPFYAKCVELDVPYQLQVGQSMIYAPEHRTRSVARPITLDGVACDFPELRLIGIHIGIPWHDEMIAMAWKHPNLFIGSDAHSPRYWPASFVRFIDSWGQDKVIFGTDFPVIDFQRAMDEIDALKLRPEARQKLLRDNVLRVYRLEL